VYCKDLFYFWLNGKDLPNPCQMDLDKPSYLDALYELWLESDGVSTDSRLIKRGQLFVALKGPNFDGNRYATQALDNGASYAIVDDLTLTGDRYFHVPDTLYALQTLARHHRARMRAKVIGLTGSNGKTTTKELISAILSRRYKVSATQGNLNNHIGVPLTILNAQRASEILIVEMGTNQPGDISLLCQIADPDIGLITNIGAAHLEQLIDLDGVLDEKANLLRHVNSRGGIIFINQGDPKLSSLSFKNAQSISYRADNVSGVGKLYVTDTGSNTLSIVVDNDGRQEIHSHLSGSYNLENIAAALSIGQHCDVGLLDMIGAIETYHPDNMRSQILHTDLNTIILDAYNANPSSMKASLLSTHEEYGADLIVILGDMLELGVYGDEAHIEILDLIDSLGIAERILVGPIFMSKTDDAYVDVDTLLDSQRLEHISGATVLIKGSRGIRLEKIVPHL